MPCQCNKFTFEEKPDVFQMFQGGGGAVKSVNGKTGVVVLDAGDIGYDGETTYPDASVGKELGTINSALSSLSAVTEIIDTASGAIASFPDGSGTPMRSLLAQIEPQQDLHGYDAPWPAGGGKNLFDPTANPDKWINASGQLTTVTGAKASQQIPCAQGDTFTVSTESGISTLAICFYASDDSVTQRTAQQDSASLTATAPANTAYVRSATYGESGKEVQLEKGSSKTSFLPYSNECPITGWTGLSGKRCGKNLLAGIYAGGINNTTGEDETANNGVCDYIRVDGSETYTVSGSTIGDNAIRIFEYDLSKHFIRTYTASGSNNAVTFTTGETASYVRLKASQAVLAPNGVYQLEVGSTASDFEAYNSLPITVSWQTEAGTVYDGYIDVVSGELVATHKSDSLTDAWSQASNGAFYLDGKATDGKSGVNDQLYDALCNIYPSGYCGGSTHIGIQHAKTLCVQNLNGIRFIVYDTSWASVADFNSYVAQNPIQIVYPLATPQTYQLTPQQISTLLGNNTVFVDTGSVSVTYQASIKGYIDKVLGA